MTGRDDKLPSVLVLAQDGRTAPLRTLVSIPDGWSLTLLLFVLVFPEVSDAHDHDRADHEGHVRA